MTQTEAAQFDLVDPAVDPAERPHPDLVRRPRVIPEILGLLPAVLAFALLLAVFVDIPGLSAVATSTIGFSAWIACLCLLLLAYGFVLLARHRTSMRWLTVALAAFTLVGTGAITAQTQAFADQHDIEYHPFSGYLAPRPADHVAVYRETSERGDLQVGVWLPPGHERNEDDTFTATSGAPAPVLVHVPGELTPFGAEAQETFRSMQNTVTDLTGDTPPIPVEETAGPASPGGADATLARWADAGWMVLNVGYTPASADDPTSVVAVDQVQCALAYVNAHSEQLAIDMDRLAVVGSDTGGLVALDAVFQHGSEEEFTDCGEVPATAAFAGRSAVVDPIDLAGSEAPFVGEEARTWARDFHGGTPSEVPEAYTASAPHTYINSDVPPVVLFTAGRDRLVPGDTTRAFATAANRDGRSVTTRPVPHAGHGFGISPLEDRMADAVHRWLTDTLPDAPEPPEDDAEG
ncbi:alpha/beta hydrolase [Brevibacterium litoralis]|uniref:alpha/beta hydrolase n=1 Tax=Brevibacterium litoralis TaxID=3138935 RepID=UPI0032EC2026